MVLGFIIWSLVCIILLGIGILSWRAKEPVGFFTGVRPPKVKDTSKYNHSVALLWFVYAGLMEVLGIPLLFLEQNSSAFIPVIFGVLLLTIALMIVYVLIEKKCRIS